MMKKIIDAAIVGSRGFVGSNLTAALKRNERSVFEIDIDTKMDEIEKYSFDCVYFCAGNPLTFLAKKEPLKCLQQNVADLYPYLTKLEYNKFIYLSSILVYPQNSGVVLKEDIPIDISQLNLYGAHKYMGERYVREFAKKWLIVRPTSFFGAGLKKNLLFDLRNGNPKIFLKKNSWIDYMPVDWFCSRLIEIEEVMSNDILNLGSACPISVAQIVSFKDLPFIFLEERWQDDRNIDFTKLKNLKLPMLQSSDLEKMVKEFII